MSAMGRLRTYWLNFKQLLDEVRFRLTADLWSTLV
jgi:hypothetical protein